MVACYGAVRLFAFVLILGQYNRISLCEWVLARLRVCLRAYACHNTSVLHLALDHVWTLCLLWMQFCTKCYGLVNNSVRKVSVTLLLYFQTRYEFCCVCFYQSALCRVCVFVLYWLCVCYKTLKLKKLNKFTKKFIVFYNLFKERGREPMENYFRGAWRRKG